MTGRHDKGSTWSADKALNGVRLFVAAAFAVTVVSKRSVLSTALLCGFLLGLLLLWFRNRRARSDRRQDSQRISETEYVLWHDGYPMDLVSLRGKVREGAVTLDRHGEEWAVFRRRGRDLEGLRLHKELDAACRDAYDRVVAITEAEDR